MKDEWEPIETAPVDEYILISFANFPFPDIGRYEVDDEGDGAFYPGDDDKSYVSYNLIINGWMKFSRCKGFSEENEEKGK